TVPVREVRRVRVGRPGITGGLDREDDVLRCRRHTIMPADIAAQVKDSTGIAEHLPRLRERSYVVERRVVANERKEQQLAGYLLPEPVRRNERVERTEVGGQPDDESPAAARGLTRSVPAVACTSDRQHQRCGRSRTAQPSPRR